MARRPKLYVFAFRSATRRFDLRLSFARRRVTRVEVIDALEQFLRELHKPK